MVRLIRDPLLGTLLIGDVLVGGDKSAVCDRMVHNANDASIGQVRYLAKDSSLVDPGQYLAHILLEVVGEKLASCDPMVEEFSGSYTHLTLPTILRVWISGVAV